ELPRPSRWVPSNEIPTGVCSRSEPGRRASRPRPGWCRAQWRGPMRNLTLALIGLAALAFLLAVASSFTGPVGPVQAEGFSRASTNLALLAIALLLSSRDSAR